MYYRVKLLTPSFSKIVESVLNELTIGKEGEIRENSKIYWRESLILIWKDQGQGLRGALEAKYPYIITPQYTISTFKAESMGINPRIYYMGSIRRIADIPDIIEWEISRSPMIPISQWNQ